MSIEINFIITSYINLIYSRNLIKNITIINHIPKQIKKLLNERSCSIYPDIHRFRLSTTILHNKIQNLVVFIIKHIVLGYQPDLDHTP